MNQTGHDAALREHAPMVQRMARRMAARMPRSVESDDLVQAGMIGLLEALGRFDGSQSVPFAAYANQRIRGAMNDELRNNDWAPRSLRSSQRHAASAANKLRQTLHREPQAGEMAQELRMNLNDYHRLDYSMHCAQIECIDDVIEDAELVPVDDDKDAQCIALSVEINQLSGRNQQIMGMRYESDMTWLEIGAVFGVSDARVCQEHKEIVSLLRQKLKGF